MARIGVIGLGYWGPNLVRNFSNLPESEVTIICDRDLNRLQQVGGRFPNVKSVMRAEEVLSSGLVDAVVIATPTSTHYALAKQAIENGLHAFVEKPLAISPAECAELLVLAEEKKVVLFVGHVFLYSAAVAKLKDLIEKGELGNLYYISSTRLNLGPVRWDVNALWDLAAHDVSIILYLMNASPVGVNCQGLARLAEKIHDICTLTLHFDNNTMAIVHVSWLDPNKKRIMTIVGDKKMAVYNDIEPLEKIKVYNKGVECPRYSDTFGEFHYSYRYGDTWSPVDISQDEPLKLECLHFLECIKTGKKPLTDGKNGLDVVRVLHAADISLQNAGGRVQLNSKSTIEQPRLREMSG